MTSTFSGWCRSTLAAGAEWADGRGTARFTAHVDDQPLAEVPVTLAGPGDVGGIDPHVVRRVHPTPGSSEASTGHCPFVEFTAADFPWRYTPEPADGAALRPWLALVVAIPGEEFDEPSTGFVRPRAIGGSADGRTITALDDYDLSLAARWAHVQSPDQTLERAVSRILSFRPLRGRTEYVALLVPAFVGAGADLRPAWGPEPGNSPLLPVYHRWSFRTGEAGTFDELAHRLQPLPTSPDAPDDASPPLGATRVTYGRWLPQAPPPFQFLGALTRHVAATPAPPPIRADLAQLTDMPPDPDGREVLGLPDYTRPWSITVDTLKDDPGLRATAGLGSWCAVEMQADIVAAAARHDADLAVIRDRLRALTAGIAAARRLWDTRLCGPVPASVHPLRLLGVLAHAVGAIVHAETDRPLDRLLTDGDSALPAALFSGAAHRVTRPGTARTRYTATAVGWSGVLRSANRCPGPAPAPAGLPDLNGLADGLGLSVPPGWTPSGNWPAGWNPRHEYGDDLGGSQVQEDATDVIGWESAAVGHPTGVVPGPWTPWTPVCRPVPLNDLADVLIDQLSPGLSAVDRVFETFELPGRVSAERATWQDLAPPEPSLRLDLPGWRFLRERAPELVCPGVGGLPADSVTALRPNPAFVEAFLLGLNAGVHGELRWHNLTLPGGATPVMSFWGREGMDDITPISQWSGPLGSHHQPGAQEPQTVVVVRSAVFRRWPQTLVYLLPDGAPPSLAGAVAPVWSTAVDSETVLLWFDRPLADHWFVLEEGPVELRFSISRWQEWFGAPADGAMPGPRADAPPDGAAAAAASMDRQTRAGIWGNDLLL